jgi:hypothetical protein
MKIIARICIGVITTLFSIIILNLISVSYQGSYSHNTVLIVVYSIAISLGILAYFFTRRIGIILQYSFVGWLLGFIVGVVLMVIFGNGDGQAIVIPIFYAGPIGFLAGLVLGFNQKNKVQSEAISN